MKKICLLLILICILGLLAACTAKSGPAETGAAPGTTAAPATESKDVPQSATAGQGPPAAQTNPAGQITPHGQTPPDAAAATPRQNAEAKTVSSGLSLEAIKKTAIAAGYKAQDGEVRPGLEPPPVALIYINYEDEYKAAQDPVYEFKSAEDALAFAKEVNASDYSLSIVNGKFLAPIAAKYGVIENDKELAVLEKLLQSKVMEYREPIPAALVPSKDYAGAFKQLDTIRSVLNRMVNRAILLYGKTRPPEEAQNIAGLSFSLVSSGNLRFTAQLSEDQAAIDSVQKLWERFGCTEFEIKHDTPHNYVLSGKRVGVDEKFMISCAYDPATQALRLVEKDPSGAARDYFEYVPLGADKYAFQTEYDRALVEYKDGKIISLIYSRKDSGDAKPYDPDKDSIYPNGSGVNDAWAAGAGIEKSEDFITYDGTTLHVTKVTFSGKRLKMDISVP